MLVRAYDYTLAPATQILVKHVLRIGSILYGGNFAVRRDALDRIGGFDLSIEFHGEDTNLGRRLFAVGRVKLAYDCYLYTSARRYVAMGKGAVFRLYVRNFISGLLTQNRLRGRLNSHIIALDVKRYITADQPASAILKDIRDQDALSIACHPHHRTTRRLEISKPKHLYSWKTLLRCDKTWPAIKQALRSNVDVALVLFRNGAYGGGQATSRH